MHSTPTSDKRRLIVGFLYFLVAYGVIIGLALAALTLLAVFVGTYIL